jgi:hypothetical protein
MPGLMRARTSAGTSPVAALRARLVSKVHKLAPVLALTGPNEVGDGTKHVQDRVLRLLAIRRLERRIELVAGAASQIGRTVYAGPAQVLQHGRGHVRQRIEPIGQPGAWVLRIAGSAPIHAVREPAQPWPFTHSFLHNLGDLFSRKVLDAATALGMPLHNTPGRRKAEGGRRQTPSAAVAPRM